MTTIGFIGAGQMAQALGKAIASSDSTFSFQISDPCANATQAFSTTIGVDRVECVSNNQLAAESDVVFLAVKPQYLHDALEEVSCSDSTLVVSIVTGVRIFELERLIGSKRIIRIMPNTPCLIGKGASGLAAGSEVHDGDVELAKNLLGSSGMVVEVPEDLLDSVTGISGSGPAYVYTFIEAMIDGGVLTGMPRRAARTLAIQTVLGAAEMLVQTDSHPAELRDQVTSPGGTTIAALKALEETGFRDSVMSAVLAATEKSRDLGG